MMTTISIGPDCVGLRDLTPLVRDDAFHADHLVRGFGPSPVGGVRLEEFHVLLMGPVLNLGGVMCM